MSNNSQKTPLGLSLNRFAESKVMDAFQRAGQALPCSVVSVSGAIITVQFEVNTSFTLPNVTVPMFGAEYIRYPIKKGDKGCVFPADARLSGMSGIGGGVADLSQPANLTALVFAPISNISWTAVDADAVTLYGPNGVVMRDTGGQSKITLTPSGIAIDTPQVTVTTTGNVTVHAGGNAVISCAQFNATATDSASITAPTIALNGTVNASGAVNAVGDVTTLTGDVVAGLIHLKTHRTSGVTPGILISGPPVV